MMIGRLNATAMDCPVPIGTARFYRRLLGGSVSPDEEADWVNLYGASGREILSFRRAEDYVAPTWSDNSVPLQVHSDIVVSFYKDAEPTVFDAGGRLRDDSLTWQIFS
jgi:hypothetical protein